MSEASTPFLKGFLLIIGVGITISLVGIVGETLEWATIPSPERIREVVLEEIKKMPWYKQMAAEDPEFIKRLDLFLRAAKFITPDPWRAVINVVTTPIAFLISWLVYSFLAHIFARILGGKAKIAQTLGCTALAVSPQLLKLANILPYVEIGGVVGAWTLACNYLAIKIAHRLSSGRAFWATFLPFIIISLLLILLIAGGVALAIATIGALGGKP
jgi:hypothetical protein